jgi:putative Mg2+ transporter-C (MgtC) family protein
LITLINVVPDVVHFSPQQAARTSAWRHKGVQSMISFPMMLFRLSVAIVLGGAVGLEREHRVHTAGMRTHALVALGSALFTLISIYGFIDLLGLPHVQVDPSRIASYVVAGIGFLGGGVIAFQHEQERVRGLTTAAAIWVVAALGMACGAGLIVEAVAATILAVMV